MDLKRIAKSYRMKRSGAKICCQGCGKVICDDDLEQADFSDVQYVKTKRGTEFFFHTGCADEVWKHGIV